VSYEALLDRRILPVDWVGKTGDQNDLAWAMIVHAQASESFGISRGSTTPHAKNRSRTIRKGVTIRAGLNDLAAMEQGYDWWIDKNRNFQTQTPRRQRTLPRSLGWGQGFTAIKRSGAYEDYASRVMTIGALRETKLPDGTVYPPPPAQIVRAPTMPFGLWESSFSYPDVLTVGTLIARAEWNLTEATSLRASYKCTLEPGIWNPADMEIGDLFNLRISSPPRTNVNEQVRIEEIAVAITPDGGELVTMQVRQDELQTTPLGRGATRGHYGPLAAPTPLPGETTLADDRPSGRSTTSHHIAPEDTLGRMFSTLAQRITRNERS
jgi:hypothetical protein